MAHEFCLTFQTLINSQPFLFFYHLTRIWDLNTNWTDETYVEADGGVFAECTLVM